MVNSAAGLAALALFVLVLGYWVPLRARQRQELADARVDDRFSAGLRVLAVAAHPPGSAWSDGARADGARADETRLAAARSGGRLPVKVPVRSEAREETTVAPRPRTSTTPFLARRELLAVRAARARRRMILTVGLVLAVLAACVTVVTTAVPWFVVLVPGLPLVGVLGLGRAASAAARRADARWEAERRAAGRRAVQARALAAGGPRAPINRARVTGRAVHGSSAMTQMLPRVAIEVVEGVVDPDASAATGTAGTAATDTADSRTAGAAAASSGPTPSPSASRAPGGSRSRESAPVPGAAGSAPVSSDPAPAPAPGPGPVEPTTARPARESASAAPVRTGEPWEPRPVPLPTYVTKAEAPAREPRPLTGVTPVSSGWSTSPWQRPQDSVDEAGEASTSWSLGATQTAALGQTATPASGVAAEVDPVDTPEPRPVTETLGLPLEQILARRRAAG